MQNPNEITAAFRAHWTGTESDLAAALEAFYRDIRHSFELAMSADGSNITPNDVLETVDDYVTNHYAEG